MVHEFLKIEEEGASLEIEAGAVSSFKSARKAMNGVRVIKDGQLSTASFVGEIKEEELLQRCLDTQGGGVPCDYELPKNSQSERKLGEPKLRGLSELHRQASAALEFLRSKNDRFIYSGKAVSQRTARTHSNSQGLRHYREHDEAYWWITYKHKESKSLMDGYFTAQGFSGFNFMDSVQRHLPLLNAFERLLPTPLGMRKVIIVHPHEHLFSKLGQSLRIDRYREGSCLYAGKLGQKIFSDKFSLDDLRDDPSRCVFRPFDGEGTPASAPLPLISKGVFSNLICDLRYGKKYGVPSTGNGQRSFNSNAGLGFNGLALQGGPSSLEQFVQSMDECILVTLAMGGDTTDNGDFSLPVNLAFVYKNGQLQGRLDSFTLKSSVSEMFGPRLLAVSSDPADKNGLNPAMVMEMEVLA
jgi:PmbA protein